jgi:hypothetical protein
LRVPPATSRKIESPDSEVSRRPSSDFALVTFVALLTGRPIGARDARDAGWTGLARVALVTLVAPLTGWLIGAWNAFAEGERGAAEIKGHDAVELVISRADARGVPAEGGIERPAN